MKPRLTRMTAGLAIGITAAVGAAGAIAAYFYSVHHQETILATARSTALAETDLVRVALEHQMIENDRSLIARMVESFGRQPGVRRVLLLDRTGHVRYSSAPTTHSGELLMNSPTCQACHQYPAPERSMSRVIETSSGEVLRTMVPFRNREACHGCHDPSHAINGVMLLDLDVGEARAEMNHDLRWMVAGTGVLALLLTSVIALLIRGLVLRRLQRFEITARQIANGDLDKRVPADGSDTIAWLASEFNAMADSVTGLLSDVREERERLERVINSIGDGVVVLDGKRNVIAANDAFLKRAGRVRDDVLGRCCRDVPGACGIGDCPTLGCLQSGEAQVRICERVAPDGTVSCEEVHASPIRGPSGELAQVVEVWRDISERRAAEARLAEAHKMASLGLLASGFSHELNTPLGTVLTSVEGILHDVQRTDGAASALDSVAERAAIAREQILRCRGITGHFLRMASGQKAVIDIVDLPAAVAAVARLVEPAARVRSVAIEVGSIPSTPGLRADQAELERALINLILNAVQACRTGGRVSISAEANGVVRIRVRDDGCGIAPEHQKRIFEPFFSLRQGGTGLGLFLTANTVRGWGGEISVSSAPGEGSVFEIVLPSEPPPAAVGFAS
jgi:PAS domain S-box-containing protein